MITIDEKVNFFKKIVLDKIDYEYQELEDSLEQSFQSEVENFKEKSREKSENYIDKFVTKAKNEKKLRVLESKRAQKEKILSARNKLIEKIYGAVLDMASEFIGTEGYYELIEKLITKGKDELKSFDVLNIELCSQDYKHKEKIRSIIEKHLNEKAISFYETDQNFNGGLIIMDKNKEMRLDLSLSSIVQRNRVFIGNQVQGLLDQKSDLDE
ncbi:MAG TPA: V-type ATP synthase subunit E family protein [Clostridia bacterium]|nr:V-type ATP synthase subunit E family protein [Clostridia bacterium]